MENNIDEKVSPLTKDMVTSEKNKEGTFKQGLWDLIKFAVIALAIVFPIRMFIAQPFVVQGDSMYPTFHTGQYLIVDELSYSLKGPQRGDVVIFKYPHDPSRYFIKRIIGMPNEKVVINDGKVSIANKENPKGFNLTEPYINEKFNVTNTYTTGDDQFFVMGDNRNRSSDSREWGLLPRKLMVGRAYVRLLPIADAAYLPGAYKEVK